MPSSSATAAENATTSSSRFAIAAGAGAVGKLVDNTVENCNKRDIERLFHQKYPYEYLLEDKNQAFREAALKFYREHGMLD